MVSKKSVFGFVLGWVTSQKSDAKEAEDAMRETGQRLGLAFGEGVLTGIQQAQSDAMAPTLELASPTPVNRIANGKAKPRRKATAKTRSSS